MRTALLGAETIESHNGERPGARRCDVPGRQFKELRLIAKYARPAFVYEQIATLLCETL